MTDGIKNTPMTLPSLLGDGEIQQVVDEIHVVLDELAMLPTVHRYACEEGVDEHSDGSISEDNGDRDEALAKELKDAEKSFRKKRISFNDEYSQPAAMEVFNETRTQVKQTDEDVEGKLITLSVGEEQLTSSTKETAITGNKEPSICMLQRVMNFDTMQASHVSETTEKRDRRIRMALICVMLAAFAVFMTSLMFVLEMSNSSNNHAALGSSREETNAGQETTGSSPSQHDSHIPTAPGASPYADPTDQPTIDYATVIATTQASAPSTSSSSSSPSSRQSRFPSSAPTLSSYSTALPTVSNTITASYADDSDDEIDDDYYFDQSEIGSKKGKGGHSKGSYREFQ